VLLLCALHISVDMFYYYYCPSPLLDNIQVMVIVWRLRGNIIRTVLGFVTLCSQYAIHLYEQFLQVQQIGFVTLGPLRHA